MLRLALALIALSPAALAGTWVVDASGGGDFTELQPAIDAAAPGDVIFVIPQQGSARYAPAVVDKALDIVAPSDFDPTGAEAVLESLDVQGAPRITLYHLNIDRLRLQSVAGPAVIDFCGIGIPIGPVSPWPSVHTLFLIQDSMDVRISQSGIHGYAYPSWGMTGLVVRGASSVQLTSSWIQTEDVPDEDYLSGWAGHALEVRDTSAVWVGSTTLWGGDGEDHWEFGYLVEEGQGGHALLVGESAYVDVRGNTSDSLHAGVHDVSHKSPPHDGKAVACESATSAAVLLAGVNVEGVVDPCAIQETSTKPFLGFPLMAFEHPGMGDPYAAQLYGEAGAAALLVASLGVAQLELPILETTPLWLSPAQVIAIVGVTLMGIETPAEVGWTQPSNPAFLGLVIHLQGFELLASGSVRGTNSGSSVLSR